VRAAGVLAKGRMFDMPDLCSLIPDALNTNCNPQHDKHHQVGYIHVYEPALFYSRYRSSFIPIQKKERKKEGKEEKKAKL